MVQSNKARAHGQTGAEAEAKEQGKELAKVLDFDPDKPLTLTRAFQRLRTDWHGQDYEIIQSVKNTVEDQLNREFEDAIEIRFKLFNIVRNPLIDETTGEVLTDDAGLPLWQQYSDGTYVEDWSKITRADREKLVYEIATRLYRWEQLSVDAWGEALFAKAVWEEAFATGFDSTVDNKATVDARNAHANRVAADNRYLAVYKSYYSKKAEAVVRSMDRLCQRLKDLSV